MRAVGMGREWEMLQPLDAWWDGGSLHVPTGFIHDGPSIPNRLRSLVFYSHRLLKPSIVHDFLYVHRFKLWPRDRADEFLLEGLVVEEVGWVKRNAIWTAVRAGGAYAWRT